MSPKSIVIAAARAIVRMRKCNGPRTEIVSMEAAPEVFYPVEGWPEAGGVLCRSPGMPDVSISRMVDLQTRAVVASPGHWDLGELVKSVNV